MPSIFGSMQYSRHPQTFSRVTDSKCLQISMNLPSNCAKFNEDFENGGVEIKTSLNDQNKLSLSPTSLKKTRRHNVPTRNKILAVLDMPKFPFPLGIFNFCCCFKTEMFEIWMILKSSELSDVNWIAVSWPDAKLDFHSWQTHRKWLPSNNN